MIKKFPPKIVFSIIDILTGISLIFLGFQIESTIYSNEISKIFTIGMIIPGILLVAYIRLILVGNKFDPSGLVKNIFKSIILNILIISIYIFLNLNINLLYLIFLVFFFSLLSSLQPFSVAWYHIVVNKNKFLFVKICISLIRLIGTFLAYFFDEKAIFIFVIYLTPAFEFIIFYNNFKLLINNKNKIQIKEPVFNFGISVGMVRGVISLTKFFMEKSIPGILSTIIIFESIFSGIQSIYEKYFTRDIKPFNFILSFKKLYVLIIICTYGIFISFYDVYFSESIFKLFIFIFCSSIILPSILMYDSLSKYGLFKVKKINIIISSLALIVILLNNYLISSFNLNLLVYICVPMGIFFSLLVSRKN
jgi:hypothetical protein